MGMILINQWKIHLGGKKVIRSKSWIFVLILSLVVSNPSFAQEGYVTRIEQSTTQSLSLMIRGELTYEYWLEVREVQEGIIVYKCYEGEECEPLVDEVVTLEELRSALVKHNITYTLVAVVGFVVLALLAKQAGIIGTGAAASVGLGGGVGGGLLGTWVVGPASGGIAGGVLGGMWNAARAFSILTRASAAGKKWSLVEKVVVIPLGIIGSTVLGASLGNATDIAIDQFKLGRQLPAGYALADGSHLRKLLSDKASLYTLDLYKLEIELARLINVIVNDREE